MISQRFATELRNSTYARLFPEISRCVNELLSSLNHESESICRTFNHRSASNTRDGFQMGRTISIVKVIIEISKIGISINLETNFVSIVKLAVANFIMIYLSAHSFAGTTREDLGL